MELFIQGLPYISGLDMLLLLNPTILPRDEPVPLFHFLSFCNKILYDYLNT